MKLGLKLASLWKKQIFFSRLCRQKAKPLQTLSYLVLTANSRIITSTAEIEGTVQTIIIYNFYTESIIGKYILSDVLGYHLLKDLLMSAPLCQECFGLLTVLVETSCKIRARLQLQSSMQKVEGEDKVLQEQCRCGRTSVAVTERIEQALLLSHIGSPVLVGAAFSWGVYGSTKLEQSFCNSLYLCKRSVKHCRYKSCCFTSTSTPSPITFINSIMPVCFHSQLCQYVLYISVFSYCTGSLHS